MRSLLFIGLKRGAGSRGLVSTSSISVGVSEVGMWTVDGRYFLARILLSCLGRFCCVLAPCFLACRLECYCGMRRLRDHLYLILGRSCILLFHIVACSTISFRAEILISFLAETQMQDLNISTGNNSCYKAKHFRPRRLPPASNT